MPEPFSFVNKKNNKEETMATIYIFYRFLYKNLIHIVLSLQPSVFF